MTTISNTGQTDGITKALDMVMTSSYGTEEIQAQKVTETWTVTTVTILFTNGYRGIRRQRVTVCYSCRREGHIAKICGFNTLDDGSPTPKKNKSYSLEGSRCGCRYSKGPNAAQGPKPCDLQLNV